MKEKVLYGKIIEAADYNTAAIFEGLPLKARTQIIKIELESDYWKILYLKNTRIKITIEDEIINIDNHTHPSK